MRTYQVDGHTIVNYYHDNENCHSPNPGGGYGFCSLKRGHSGAHMGFAGHDIYSGAHFATWGRPLIEEDPL